MHLSLCWDVVSSIDCKTFGESKCVTASYSAMSLALDWKSLLWSTSNNSFSFKPTIKLLNTFLSKNSGVFIPCNKLSLCAKFWLFVSNWAHDINYKSNQRN